MTHPKDFRFGDVNETGDTVQIVNVSALTYDDDANDVR